MKDFYDFTPVQEALTSARTLTIVLPVSLNQDKVASALALYLSLKKASKQVSLVCSRPMIVEYSSLVGVDKIKNKLGGRNLVVSFDYLEDSIEKVSYNIENNKFNLVIQPKDGYPPLSTEKVEYSYFGEQADLIFIIGASSFEELGEIYSNNKTFFQEGNTVNISFNPNSKSFAKINLINPQMASFGEFIAFLISTLKLPVDEDIASNLLLGIERATNNFSLLKSTPMTYEAVAFCLRAGGRKPLREFPEERRAEEKKPSFAKASEDREEKVEEQQDLKVKPSPDWFKPKIYKGDTKI